MQRHRHKPGTAQECWSHHVCPACPVVQPDPALVMVSPLHMGLSQGSHREVWQLLCSITPSWAASEQNSSLKMKNELLHRRVPWLCTEQASPKWHTHFPLSSLDFYWFQLYKYRNYKKNKPKDKEQLGSIQFSYVEAHFIYFGCFNHREKEISCETSIFLASYQYLKLAKQKPLSIYSGVLMYVMELPSATLPRSWASCDCATYIYLPLMITAGQQSLTLNQKALKPALHTVLTAQTKRQEQQEVCCNTGIFQARIEQSI